MVVPFFICTAILSSCLERHVSLPKAYLLSVLDFLHTLLYFFLVWWCASAYYWYYLILNCIGF